MAAEQAGAEYEAQHVHDVYEQIASHFSATRYKPWPVIEKFLQGLTPGSVGLDIGCGNGKYLTVNPDVFIVGSDRSPSLVKFASSHQPHAAVVSDILALPHQNHNFDFAISIAVLHHLSTPERRVEAVQTILDTLNANGKALLYVWALEQKDSRRGWDEGNQQDTMVPWVMREKKEKQKKDRKQQNKGDATQQQVSAEQTQTTGTSLEPAGDKTFYRYYHLYRKGELEENIELAGGTIVEAGYDRDNWWAICQRKQT
ncbi:S-adenosyl-L-methionine-dependent methyltransferase [Aureobasidium sp. EXF-10728]|nr:S-adenosyl-L-methionine-dependent methyltransferase [Aureobasidium sp. EXF-10728]